MSIRSIALQWLSSNYGINSKEVFVSKIYTSDESWTKGKVWWFEIHVDRIKSPSDSYFHLLCQVAPEENDFFYLKVPAEYLQEKLPKLTVRNNGKMSIFLSAESHNLFVDERSHHNVGFKQFLVKSDQAF